MSEVEAERYIGIGQEAAYGKPEIQDTVAVSAAPFTPDRDVPAPSILEVVATGITTPGAVDINGIVNGEPLTESIAIANGDSVVPGLEIFESIDQGSGDIDVSGGLAGGTISVRISTQEFVDMVDETVKATNSTLTTEDRVRARFFQFSAMGPLEIAGDVNLIAEPEGGFLRLLKMALCAITHTATGGRAVLDPVAIAATHTFDRDILPNDNGGDKQIRVIVTGTAVAGTVAIPGDVNGVAVAAEVLTLNAANGFIATTTRFFDALDLAGAAIATTGLTAGTITIQQADAYDHLLTPGARALSFFARIGMDGIWEREVQGLGVDGLDLVMNVDKYVRAKLSLTGRTEQENAVATPSFDDIEPFNFAEGTITRDAVSYPIIMESTLSLKNNQAKDRRAIDGGRKRRALPWQGGSAEMTLKMLFEDLGNGEQEEYQKFYGTTGDKTPQSTATPWDLDFQFTSENEIYAADLGSAAQVFEMGLEVPTAIVDELSAPIKGRDVITQEAKLLLKNDPAVGYPFRIRIRNGQARV